MKTFIVSQERLLKRLSPQSRVRLNRLAKSVHKDVHAILIKVVAEHKYHMRGFVK